MQFALVYIVGCFLVALLGTNRKLGFWGYLFFSLLLTPVVGLITVLASDTRGGRKVLPALPGTAPGSEGFDEAARSYMARIDRLVASHRITRDYASRQLVPLLVRDVRGTAGSSGTDGQRAGPLDTILAALEALPMPATATIPGEPQAG